MTPADRAEVQQMIKQGMAKSSQLDRFNLTNVQQHEHGDIGSRTVAQPSLTYVGAIDYNGKALILPRGWTCSLSAGTVFTVTHNLNTSAYTVLCNEIYYYNVPAVASIAPASNSFEVSWIEVAHTGTLLSTPFYFSLTNVANRITKPPVYEGTWTSTTYFPF